MGGWFGAGAPGPADSLSLGSEPKECGLTTQEGGCPDGLSWYSTPLRLWPTLTATRSIIATLFGTGAHAATRPTLRCALRLRPKYAVDSRVAYSGRRHDYVVSSHPNRPCNNSPQHTPWWWLSRMVVDSLPIWAVQEATLGGGSGGGDSGPPYGASCPRSWCPSGGILSVPTGRVIKYPTKCDIFRTPEIRGGKRHPGSGPSGAPERPGRNPPNPHENVRLSPPKPPFSPLLAGTARTPDFGGFSGGAGAPGRPPPPREISGGARGARGGSRDPRFWGVSGGSILAPILGVSRGSILAPFCGGSRAAILRAVRDAPQPTSDSRRQ